MTEYVKKGGRYPADAVEVIGETSRDVEVRFSPLGGGFVYRASTESFAEKYRRVTDKDRAAATWRKTSVATDAMEEQGIVLDAWTQGDLWNGWAKPLFEKAEALKIAEIMGEGMTYDAEKDRFVDHLDGEQEVYEKMEIEAEGRTIEVYPIGTGSWCWSEVGESEPEFQPPR